MAAYPVPIAIPPVMHPSSSHHHLGGGGYQQQSIRPGTIPQGTLVRIGEYQVEVERFLSEGGFAHVYLVRSSQPIPSSSNVTQHVLKRVAVPDKETLREVRWEVDVMKLVRGHKHIVNLIEASASPIPGTTGYEVFILMEYCAGGGIIDMMNTRLQNRLTESEILKIFSDVVEAVCWMHTREPPLAHRDLKVENILLSASNLYKLCDFGSTTSPKPYPPQSMQEIQMLEAELNKHTTLQYRAPEMCDVWSRKGVGLPADIWALGVLLYKLCFYTTPFEEQGPLAILNVQYQMPAYPAYSQEIRQLISSMLVENQSRRPTAYDVHKEVCRLRGAQVKTEYQSRVKQIAQPTPSPAFSGLNTPIPSRPNSSHDKSPATPSRSAPHSGTHLSVDTAGISPMRRGRPTKGSGPISAPPVALPSTSAAVNSEWQVSNAFGASMVSSSTTGPKSPAMTSFGDSFDPTVKKPPAPATTGQQHKTLPDVEIEQSKTALATAALFEELSNPGSTIKAPPTLASLAAARESAPFQQRDIPQQAQKASFTARKVTPTKPLGPRPQLPFSLSSASRTDSSTSVHQTSTPSSSFLSPPAPSKGTVMMPFSSSSAAPMPSLAPKPSSAMGALEHRSPGNSVPGTAAALADPENPKLVSRASQTAADWQEDYKRKRAELQELTSGTSVAKAAASGQKASSQSDGSRPEMERFPSIDDWESPGFSPPGVKPQPSRNISGGGAQEALPRTPAVDLLEEDEDGIGTAPSQTMQDSAVGNPSTSPAPLESSPSAEADNASTQNLESKDDVSGNASTPSARRTSDYSKAEPPKEKFKPVRRDSPVVQRHASTTSATSTSKQSPASPLTDKAVLAKSPVPIAGQDVEEHDAVAPDSKDVGSSDDEQGPEEATGGRYGPGRLDSAAKAELASSRGGEGASQDDTGAQQQQQPIRMSSQEGSGNFDLGPAFASIQRFAPATSSPSLTYKSSTQTGTPPPILAPKPRKAGISDMVSRYESLSVGNPTADGGSNSNAQQQQQQQQQSSKEASLTSPKSPIRGNGLPPKKPPKPSPILSTASSLTSSAAKPSAQSSKNVVGSPSTRDLAARFPALDERHEQKEKVTGSEGQAGKQNDGYLGNKPSLNRQTSSSKPWSPTAPASPLPSTSYSNSNQTVPTTTTTSNPQSQPFRPSRENSLNKFTDGPGLRTSSTNRSVSMHYPTPPPPEGTKLFRQPTSSEQTASRTESETRQEGEEEEERFQGVASLRDRWQKNIEQQQQQQRPSAAASSYRGASALNRRASTLGHPSTKSTPSWSRTS